MLHELLMACLGYPGDIIIETYGTFKVRENFELLSQAEIEQINKIVPLGWFCNRLSSYADSYVLRCVDGFRSDTQVYNSALCTGIIDLIDEYTRDIAYFESQINSTETLTSLSHLISYLQKVK